MKDNENIIVIDSGPFMYRTAVLEQGRLMEIIIDKKTELSLVGNIYAASVRNITPSRFAFVDIGEKKNAFLFLDDNKEGLKKPVYRKNEQILVQVIKDPTDGKGAYVTTQLNFTGRLCALVANERNRDFSAVSKKIGTPSERERLQKLAQSFSFENCSVIIRTSAEGVPDEDITSEAEALFKIYENIRKSSDSVKPPQKLYSDEHPLERVIVNLLNKNTCCVYVNSEEAYTGLLSAAGKHKLDLAPRLRLYYGEKPIFESFNIEKQIDKALEKKLWLKSGAFLYIERTEAMSIFDVNSGKYPGRVDNEKSMFSVNIEAAAEIARQMRLRNLSGIIIVDFIDMKDEKLKSELVERFRAECAKDRIAVNVLGMTRLGLVELTRKKTREPIMNILGTECNRCFGGKVKSPYFEACEIFNLLTAENARTGCVSFIVSCKKKTAAEFKVLMSDQNGTLSGISVDFKEIPEMPSGYSIHKKLSL